MVQFFKKSINYRWNRTAGITWLIFTSFFHGIGCYVFFMQINKIKNFQPVPAVVIGKKVQAEDGDGDGSRTYAPRITYQYNFQNRTFENDRVFPLVSGQNSRTWARKVIYHYHIKQKVTAYVNPKKPEESFLIRQYLISPIIWLGIVVLAGLFGLNSIFRTRELVHNPGNPKKFGSDSFKFAPAMSIKKRLVATVVAFIYVGVFAGYPTFFFLTNLSLTNLAPPNDVIFYIFSFLNTLIFFIFFGVVIHKIMLLRQMKDPSMISKNNTFIFDEKVKFLFIQKLKKNMAVGKIQVSLVCMETDYEKFKLGGFDGKSNKESDTEMLSDDKIFFKEKFYFFENTIQCDVSFHIPNHLPPSSFKKLNEFPKYYWYVRYVLEIKDYPDYTAIYPIKVLRTLR